MTVHGARQDQVWQRCVHTWAASSQALTGMKPQVNMALAHTRLMLL